MKITDHILLFWLENSVPIVQVKNVGNVDSLQGALFYQGQQKLNKGWIYIMDSPADLAENVVLTGGCFLIFTSGTADIDAYTALPPETGWALIYEDPSVVMNAIIQSLDMAQSWIDELQEILLASGNAQSMLDQSYQVFGNPLILFRDDLTVEASAGEEGMKEAEELMVRLADAASHMDLLNAFIHDKTYVSNQNSQNVYQGPEYLTGVNSLNLNLKTGDGKEYILSVIQGQRPLSQVDADLLKILGNYLMYVLRMPEMEPPGLQKLQGYFRRILTDRTFDYMEASRSLEEQGWSEKHSYMCLVYQLTYLNNKTLPVQAICNYMEKSFPGCCCFNYADGVVSFFDLDLCGQSEESVENALKPFIRDSYLKAGYSRVVTGHLNLRRLYVQCTIALDVGGRKSPYRWIHHFDDVAFTYITEQVTKRLPAEMICHEGVLELKRHDEQNGSEYISTLRAWFENGENAVHAAQALYIHRSTFLYRMEKIRELMETELDDPEELLYISLSLRLLVEQS